MKRTYLWVVLLALSSVTVSANQADTQPNSIPEKMAVQSVDKLDINQVSLKQLIEIKGVGEKRAQAIILYRQQKGTINSVEELANIKGIGSKSVNNLKLYLTVINQS